MMAEVADLAFMFDLPGLIMPGDLVRPRDNPSAPQVEVVESVDDDHVLVKEGSGSKKVKRKSLTLF